MLEKEFGAVNKFEQTYKACHRNTTYTPMSSRSKCSTEFANSGGIAKVQERLLVIINNRFQDGVSSERDLQVVLEQLGYSSTSTTRHFYRNKR
jgi:hypothetical protein